MHPRWRAAGRESAFAVSQLGVPSLAPGALGLRQAAQREDVAKGGLNVIFVAAAFSPPRRAAFVGAAFRPARS